MVRRRLRELLQGMVKRKKKLPQVTAPRHPGMVKRKKKLPRVTAPRLQDTAVRKKRVLLATVNKAEV
jgi:hypothetical protein